MVTLHQHLLSTILNLHLLLTLHLRASHKRIAMKSVPPVVPPVVVAEAAREARVATTVASVAVDTQALVARVGKVEKEDAVVSITGMLRVKQSVNLLVIINRTHILIT